MFGIRPQLALRLVTIWLEHEEEVVEPELFHPHCMLLYQLPRCFLRLLTTRGVEEVKLESVRHAILPQTY